MADRYEPKGFESKWQAHWKQLNLFKTREESHREKYYVLDFFPYPSGSGLSVGHCRNYIPTDVLARMKNMQGYNVMHPMGFDSFGLPAENEAIAKKTHPAKMIQNYAANYRRQLELIGTSFDWSRCFSSSDPSYYKWTQWIFKILFERGLAYRKMAAVNWDPVEKTVLADEEVIGGRGWRSGALVEKKYIPQWFLKITAYADRLLEDLDELDWPEGIKQQQRNWIGKSEGIELDFQVVASNNQNLKFTVFTTRVDTIFGVSYCVLAPEHALIEELLKIADQEHQQAVRKYQEQVKVLSDQDRLATNREKTGVFTGCYCINPMSGEKIPIWIADYVLASYGTGAVMGVPGHDERDFEFIKKFNLPCKIVVSSDGTDRDEPLMGKEGVLINSGEYSGLSVLEGIEKISDRLEQSGLGKRKVNYKLRDWLISRQRYWGCPIPIVYDENNNPMAVSDEDLPVVLPEVENYQPANDGSSPLSKISEFVHFEKNGQKYQRETDTMAGYADSSWYFLRFADPHNPNKAWEPEKIKYWLPVDCYVGGAEHAVSHLLYSRFWTKVLYDAGLVPFKEPFQRLLNQGMVLAKTPFRKPLEGEILHVGEQGIQISFEEAGKLPESEVFYQWEKMSKSKGNVVTPDEAVESYGADALRVFELFVAPFEQDMQWSEEGMSGSVRFLNRIFKLVHDCSESFDKDWQSNICSVSLTPTAETIRRLTHQTIGKVTDDIERFSFNTYISGLMIYLNELTDCLKNVSLDATETSEKLALSEALHYLVLLMSPAAPHSADELWKFLGYDGVTYQQNWPVSDAGLAKDNQVTVVVQINGKKRASLKVDADLSKEALEKMALQDPKVQEYIGQQQLKRVIVVPNKLVNIVVSG
jgi:leucyl-tRNA synthetase